MNNYINEDLTLRISGSILQEVTKEQFQNEIYEIVAADDINFFDAIMCLVEKYSIEEVYVNKLLNDDIKEKMVEELVELRMVKDDG